MAKKAERRRKRQEIRSAQHIAQQAREATPPDDENMRHPETPPGEPHQHGYARYAKQEVDTPPRPQHQSSFASNHGESCFFFFMLNLAETKIFLPVNRINNFWHFNIY